jgi:hypothetical protein
MLSSPTELPTPSLQSLIGYCYRDISRHRDEDTQSLTNALLAFTKISHAGN